MNYPEGVFLVAQVTARRLIVGFIISEAIFMHDPISLDASGGLSSIEDQSFLHPNFLRSIRGQHRLISSSSFPIPRCSSPVWPCSVRVLPVPWTEKVPLLFPKRRLSCTTQSNSKREKEYPYQFPFIKLQSLSDTLITIYPYSKNERRID